MVELSDVSQKTIVAWAMGRSREKRLAGSAQHLAREVGNPHGCWLQIGVDFSQRLATGLDGILELRCFLESVQDAPDNERLAQWMQWASEVGSQWPATTTDEWSQLFVVLPKNRLLTALITQSLAVSLKTLPLDSRLRDAIDHFVKHDQQWFSELPIPPEAGRAFAPQAYFHASQSAEAAGFLSSLSNNVDHFRGQVDSAIRGLRTNRRTQDLPIILNAFAELTNSAAEFSRLTGYLEQSWPVESSRLTTGLERMAAVLEKLGAFEHTTALSLLAETRVARDQLRQLVSSVSIPDPKRESVPTDAAGPLQLARKLTQWADQLSQSDTAAISGILDRLLGLSKTSNEHAAAGTFDVSNFARQVLTVLMAVDVAFTRREMRPALAETRNGLRLMLFEGQLGSDYVLLDKELIGQPLAMWLDSVDVAGTLSESKMSRDCIVKVNRPGYLFRGSEETVLRPAIVLVAE